MMRRVWKIDVTECPTCAGRLELLATITQPEVIAGFLECVGLSARPPPLAPAREPAQPDFYFKQDS